MAGMTSPAHPDAPVVPPSPAASAGSPGVGLQDDALQGRAVYSGYLLKKPSITKKGNKIKLWGGGKRKFFVLTCSSLCYYKDRESALQDFRANSYGGSGVALSGSGKDVLLTEDSDCECFYDPPHATFGLHVTTGGKVLQLVASNALERQQWKQSILTVIGHIKRTTQGYLQKRLAGAPPFAPNASVPREGALWQRRFVVLHPKDQQLTFHVDHAHGLSVQGLFKITPATTVEKKHDNIMCISSGEGEGEGSPPSLLLRTEDASDLQRWVNSINSVIIKTQSSEEDASRLGVLPSTDSGSLMEDDKDENGGAEGEDCDDAVAFPRPIIRMSYPTPPMGNDEVLSTGYLLTRPEDGSANWLPNYYILTNKALHRFHDEHDVAAICSLPLTPSCSVFETNLKAFSFELVAVDNVLHMQGASYEDSLAWIKALKAIISSSELDGEDPLIREASKLEDEFYEVAFETKQPLGVVLERTKEWAVVKLANPQLSTVSVGSALAVVNGQSCVVKSYHDTIQLLTGWKPPLRLVFRRAPERNGWLKMMHTSRRRKVGKWKAHYFILAEGKLSWFSADGPAAKLQGVVPMMGSAVSTQPQRWEPTCPPTSLAFHIVSGITSITLQGLTMEDSLDWAARICHASAVANGGGYLLDKERALERAFAKEAAEQQGDGRSPFNSQSSRVVEEPIHKPVDEPALEQKEPQPSAMEGQAPAEESKPEEEADVLARSSTRNHLREVMDEIKVAHRLPTGLRVGVGLQGHSKGHLSFDGRRTDSDISKIAILLGTGASAAFTFDSQTEFSRRRHSYDHAAGSGSWRVDAILLQNGAMEAKRNEALQTEIVEEEGEEEDLVEAMPPAQEQDKQPHVAERPPSPPSTTEEAAVRVPFVHSDLPKIIVSGDDEIMKQLAKGSKDQPESPGRFAGPSVSAVIREREQSRYSDSSPPGSRRGSAEEAVRHHHKAQKGEADSVLEIKIAEWIEAVTGKPLPPPSLPLSATLRDGTILVTVVNSIFPGSAPEPSTSSLAYRCMDNISNFVNACHMMGVPRQYLFHASVLYEHGDMRPVLRTIVALSKVSTAHGFAGPSLKGLEGLVAWNVEPDEADAQADQDLSSDEEDREGEEAEGEGSANKEGEHAAHAADVGATAAAEAPLELTDQILEQAFSSLDITTQCGYLNAMQFASLWRVLTGTQNLFREMAAFQHFNVTGNSHITLEEFKDGFWNLQADLGNTHHIIVNLCKWADTQTVSF
jgi:hypothetical protein